MWRLANFSLEERELGWELADVLVDARINQVTMPLKSLAVDEHGQRDDEFLEQIGHVLREMYLKQIADNSTTWEARVTEAMWKMIIYSDLNERLDIRSNGQIFMKIGDVTAIANNLVDEMNEEGSDLRVEKVEYQTIKSADGEEKTIEKKKSKPKRDLSSQRVGRIIREVFQLNVPPRTGKGFFCEWDGSKMMAMARKYGCMPDEEKIEEANMRLGALRAKNAGPEQMALETE